MILGEVMRKRRKFLGISQQDLAEMAGVGLATVKDIERGNANPSLRIVEMICEVLGLELLYSVKHGD